GDGEVDQTAIETSLRARIQLTVRKDMTLTWPRAETATDYISMATDPDLTVATRGAIQEMVDFLAATRKMSKHQAYQLVRVAGDTAIAAGLSDSKVTYKGKPSGGALRFTRVYARRDGRWVMIASHATRRN